MEQVLGPSASEARPTAVSVGAPPMSKAERLHRWATSLELQKPSGRAPRDGAHHARDGWCPARPSPLAVAFEDWAFQAEGLRSAKWGEVRAFFDLSERDMRHVLGSSSHASQEGPAAGAAGRIRALAERAEATAVPETGGTTAGGRVGPPVRSRRWWPGAALYRRKSATASATS